MIRVVPITVDTGVLGRDDIDGAINAAMAEHFPGGARFINILPAEAPSRPSASVHNYLMVVERPEPGDPIDASFEVTESERLTPEQAKAEEAFERAIEALCDDPPRSFGSPDSDGSYTIPGELLKKLHAAYRRHLELLGSIYAAAFAPLHASKQLDPLAVRLEKAIKKLVDDPKRLLIMGHPEDKSQVVVGRNELLELKTAWLKVVVHLPLRSGVSRPPRDQRLLGDVQRLLEELGSRFAPGSKEADAVVAMCNRVNQAAGSPYHFEAAGRHLLADTMAVLNGDFDKDTRAGLAERIQHYLGGAEPTLDQPTWDLLTEAQHRLAMLIDGPSLLTAAPAIIRNVSDSLGEHLEKYVREGGPAAEGSAFAKSFSEWLTTQASRPARSVSEAFSRAFAEHTRTSGGNPRTIAEIILGPVVGMMRHQQEQSAASVQRDKEQAEGRVKREPQVRTVKSKIPPTLFQAARNAARATKGIIGSPEYVAVHKQLLEDLRGAVERYVNQGAVAPQPPAAPMDLLTMLVHLGMLAGEGNISPDMWRPEIKEALRVHTQFAQAGGYGAQPDTRHV